MLAFSPIKATLDLEAALLVYLHTTSQYCFAHNFFFPFWGWGVTRSTQQSTVQSSTLQASGVERSSDWQEKTEADSTLRLAFMYSQITYRES